MEIKIGGFLIMKLWRNVSLGITVLFVVGALFIWFRKADAAGVKNTFAYQVIGLSIWVILFWLFSLEC
ncbi:hypothetical protein AAX19_08765 [Oenococcus oeni]|nr:hypothetical protein AAX19_08765 [Oenococcus oeni]